MLRSGLHVQLFVAFIRLVATEYSVYNNGWIPVSPDKVYNQIRREFSPTSNYYSSERNNYSKVFIDTSSTLLHRQSEISERKDVVNKGSLDWIELDTQNKLGPVSFQQGTSGIDQETIHNRGTIRKAKKISEYVVNKDVNNIIDKAEEEPKRKQAINKIMFETSRDDVKSGNSTNSNQNITAEDSTNIYKVTEDTKEDYTTDHNDVNADLEYHYPPTIRNLTSKFFDILSKYNIKANDKLQNYELSRLNKDQIPMKPNYRVPVLIPYRYNSPNHMPIDPLFAVFLSNYGVYLPGMYGISGNYNNLYGYLASNNIHNNKPFGLYKVYSDTDSSN